jgi:hypothetical protein
MVADNWFELASTLMVGFTITAALIYGVLSARPGTAPAQEDLTEENGDTIEVVADVSAEIYSAF